MLNAKARRKVKEQETEKANQLADELKIAPLVAKLLVNRGYETKEAAKAFLYKEEMSYHDPYLLDGMEKAVERIERAIVQNEKVLVFGDYDADGVSSTALLIKTLHQLGANADYYIPNRFTEGYGPNVKAFQKAKEDGCQLIISVDTGIAALEAAEAAKELEVDYIITDHHEAPPVLPEAYAIINPKKPGCSYPFKGLAGVGVVFKLAHALLKRVPHEYLDIAVIGTIADLVPLLDENRLLAIEGLQALQQTDKAGLQALKKVCGIQAAIIDAEHVGFALGPRINAAGRLKSADPAAELLLTSDPLKAVELANEIDRLNKERQAIVNEITEKAAAIVETEYPPAENDVLVIAGENWNPGVIGIVASRLVERYYRPTIVLSLDQEAGIAKGSARSIIGFDMFKELSKSRDILPHFGGHPMAAGLTMKSTDLPLLRERLGAQAKEVLTREDFQPLTMIDLKAEVEEVSLAVIEQIQKLAPFGMSNPTPKVMLEKVKIEQMRRIGSDATHLKVTFASRGNSLEAIGFNLGYLHEEITTEAEVSAVGTLSINEWNGHVKPQLHLEDVAVFEWQLFDWRSVQPVRLKKRIAELSAENSVLVAFSPRTQERLHLEEHDVLLAAELPENIDLQNRFLVLLDVPDTKAELKNLLIHYGQPSRIYTIFTQEEESFFTTNPSREHFKWYYSFLKSKKTFDAEALSEPLARHKGWSKETVTFMTDVSLELGFLTNENGLVKVVENPEKKGLEDSRLFKQKRERAEIENDLVYSSYDELKRWLTLDQEAIDLRKIKETV